MAATGVKESSILQKTFSGVFTTLCVSLFFWFATGRHPDSLSFPGGPVWKWQTDDLALALPDASAAAPATKPAAPIAATRIWTGPTSAIFRVIVKNDQSHSIRVRSGHVNLARLGMAESDSPAVEPTKWEAIRVQGATVQLSAEGELPGCPHEFSLDLTVPPHHERAFCLLVNVANLSKSQQNRFFAVGSVVLIADGSELATDDFNLFGRLKSEYGNGAVGPESPTHQP